MNCTFHNLIRFFSFLTLDDNLPTDRNNVTVSFSSPLSVFNDVAKRITVNIPPEYQKDLDHCISTCKTEIIDKIRTCMVDGNIYSARIYIEVPVLLGRDIAIDLREYIDFFISSTFFIVSVFIISHSTKMLFCTSASLIRQISLLLF